MSRSRRHLLVLAPAAGFAPVVALLIGAMLAMSAFLGGTGAGSQCTTASDPVLGAPAALRPIFQAAAERYGLGAQGSGILAGLTSVESGFGRNMGPSSAGAIGWTQFMPATWARWGVDANGDGRRSPYEAADAIYSSARYLRASGAPGDWYRALFAYNHSDAYVTTVLDRARQLTADGALTQPASGPDRATVVIGDSLEQGTFPILDHLVGGGLTGDFQRGRPSSTGIAVLRRLLRSGDYQTIVFDLGTNDPTAAMLRRSLAQLTALRGSRRLVLTTVNSPFDQRAKNALLDHYAATHPGVTLIAWHQASTHLALADGIHGAYPQRARLLATALHPDSTPTLSCEGSALAALAVGPVKRLTSPGRLVAIPDQPGMRVDARILPDVTYLIGAYHLTVTAAYATSGHAPDGEHPLGLAVDLVPGPGGSWDGVDRLAHWAEPVQNAPRPPFRWVGYDGDPGHGRGNHLHLSWNHAPDPARRPPAAWVEVFATTQGAA
jgi:hypothetical protein